MTTKTWLLIAALVLIIVIQFTGIFTPKEISSNLAKALQDTLHITRDSLNRQEAHILTLISDKKSLTAILNSNKGLLAGKDEEITRLMNKKGSTDASYVKMVTRDSVVQVPYYVDTISHIYKTKGEDKWLKYSATASPDSFSIFTQVTNEYVLSHDKVKDGEIVSVKNMNPHTTVEELISYKVAYPAPKKWSVGVGVGYGVSSDLKVRPFVGVTIQRVLIRF